MTLEELLEETTDLAKMLIYWSVRNYAGQKAVADIFAELLGQKSAKEKISAFLGKRS